MGGGTKEIQGCGLLKLLGGIGCASGAVASRYRVDHTVEYFDRENSAFCAVSGLGASSEVNPRTKGRAVIGERPREKRPDEIGVGDLEHVCKMMNNRPTLKPKFYAVVMGTTAFVNLLGVRDGTCKF